MLADGLGDLCQPKTISAPSTVKLRRCVPFIYTLGALHKGKEISKSDIYKLIDPEPIPLTVLDPIYWEEFQWFGDLREGDDVRKNRNDSLARPWNHSMGAFLCWYQIFTIDFGLSLTLIAHLSSNSRRLRHSKQSKCIEAFSIGQSLGEYVIWIPLK